jgi:hypothetical protein
MRASESLGLAHLGVTRATLATRLRGIAPIVRVQPVHVNTDVIPKRDHQDHAAIQGLAHGFQASLVREVILVAKHCFLRGAEGGCFR